MHLKIIERAQIIRNKRWFWPSVGMVCILLALFYAVKIYPQPSEDVDEYDPTNPPLLFIGNQTLPPMIYQKNNQPVGIVVDLAEAIKERMTHPVRLEYMNWAEAQQLVLDGNADALLQINPTEDRQKIYDFSAPLLESEFSIFVPSDQEDIFDVTSLRGLKVGVEEKGMPIGILQQNPLIEPVVIPDVVSGFHWLADGTIDAVVVDRWVGAFVLADNNITGIRIAGEPIDRSNSAIAVKKGKSALLAEINRALAEIKADGTYTEILAKWQPEEVVFQTRDQYLRQKIILITVLFVFFITLIWSILLLNEIKKRKKAQEILRQSEAKYRLLAENMVDVVWTLNLAGEFSYISPSVERLLGYTPQEGLAQSPAKALAPESLSLMQAALTAAMPHLEQGAGSYKLEAETYELEQPRKDGSTVWTEAVVKVLFDEHGNFSSFLGVSRDISERKKTEAEREQLIVELREALVRVKQLSGLLPICSSCKKIRDDQGYWQDVAVYVRDHSEAEFSHGICSECMENLYPAFSKKIGV